MGGTFGTVGNAIKIPGVVMAGSRWCSGGTETVGQDRRGASCRDVRYCGWLKMLHKTLRVYGNVIHDDSVGLRI